MTIPVLEDGSVLRHGRVSSRDGL